MLPLLPTRESFWRQRNQVQRLGQYSFGEACGYGFTARNEVTATIDVESLVELNHPTEAGTGGFSAAPGRPGAFL
jgi:hypothetical protein